MGRLEGGQRCLGEVGPGPGWHYAGRHSPLVERHWLQGRRPIAIGESCAALEAAFLVASGIVP